MIHQLVNKLSLEMGFFIESLEINIISSKKIEKINSVYLKHNHSTDIITFNYSENNQTDIDGEIFISIDDAIENAKKYKVKLAEEISRLIIHGLLHLLGYDDMDSKNRKNMKRQENKLLNTYKFILL
jgi:probable rRNA maturation factor